FRSELINEGFPAGLIDFTLDKLASERLIVVSQSSLATSCCSEQGVEMPSAAWQTQRDESSPLTTWFLNNMSETVQPIFGSPRTIDIVHESLVHDWDLLRTWLAESRSVMRLQRKLESSAQEWEQRHRPMGSEYLLGGTQLQETLAFLQLHRDELSDLAQDFIAASRKSQNRLRLRTSMLIPIALIAGMAASILSRFIFPPTPDVTTEREETEIQSTDTNTPAEQPDAVPSGIWQKNTHSQQLPDDAVTFPATEIEYVMVPGGKMASPDNPDELIDIWLRVPKRTDMPAPIQPSETGAEEFTPTATGTQ
ncbi:MAG: hypothetical protein AAGJ80_15180, partial [Cyanobacteria bacterium J06553_1]